MAKPRSFCKMIFLDDLTVKMVSFVVNDNFLRLIVCWCVCVCLQAQMIPREFVKNHPRMDMNMNMNMNMIPQICLIGIDEAGRYSSWDVKVQQIYDQLVHDGRVVRIRDGQRNTPQWFSSLPISQRIDVRGCGLSEQRLS